MSLQHLTYLLPSASLEDLAADRTDEEAEQVLSAASALWHPLLLTATRRIPRFFPASWPPQEPVGHVCVIPPCCETLVPTDWLRQAEEAGTRLIRDLPRRGQIVAAALDLLPERPAAEPPLAADFLALGVCHFLVELLTRRHRHMSSLDESGFESHSLAAAEAACRGDAEPARQSLQAAFDLLHSSREYAYPAEPQLLDLTLVAATTLGQSLRDELTAGRPLSLLVSGETLAAMARQEPASLAALREAIQRGQVSIVGGEYAERELPLLPPEAIRQQLCRGRDAYRQFLAAEPTIFGRRRYGLTPMLPQILEEFGFLGALHATLDDGRFPSGNQTRIRWEGLDGTTLEAVGRIPDDAGHAAAFLRLPDRLGGVLDLDNNAAVVLAHWPGRASPWLDDLRRIAAYSGVLGNFATIGQCLERTSYAGQTTQYTPDQYHSPYLTQAVAAGQRNPISRWTRRCQRRAVADAADTLTAMARLAARNETHDAPGKDDNLLRRIEDASAAPEDDAALDDQLRGRLNHALAQMAEAVIGPHPGGEPGTLTVNPHSFAHGLCPAMGFMWAAAAKDQPPPAAKAKWSLFHRRPKTPPLVHQQPREHPAGQRTSETPARDTILRNEFFAVVIDPHTGAVRSVSDYRSRGPRLSQQVALRLPSLRTDDADESAYSIMAAEEVVVAENGPELGEVVVRGRLVSRGGETLAGFRQTTRLRSGSRILELLVELDPQRLPDATPWESYYAARFAWPDPSAELYRNVNAAAVKTELVQFESPQFVEIRGDKRRTTLLGGGLPWHCRRGGRKLDTLLLVRGETCRTFRLGLGLDLANPLSAAEEFLAPATTIAAASPPQASGWLFHLNVRGVAANDWEATAADFACDCWRARAARCRRTSAACVPSAPRARPPTARRARRICRSKGIASRSICGPMNGCRLRRSFHKRRAVHLARPRSCCKIRWLATPLDRRYEYGLAGTYHS